MGLCMVAVDRWLGSRVELELDEVELCESDKNHTENLQSIGFIDLPNDSYNKLCL